jgi:GH15 family glucan-1,4-alpha-glucosidase
VEWSPRFDYARGEVRIERVEGEWIATGGSERMVLHGVGDAMIEDECGPVLCASMRMKQGERLPLVARWERTTSEPAPSFPTVDEARDMVAETVDAWRWWAARCPAGRTDVRWLPHLVRSELVLKLLTYSKTGAIVAAPTTSLPEAIGGVRNWDYRFAWIRDASLTAHALISLGHHSEAFEFLCWIERTSKAWGKRERGIHILFGVHGEAELEELELDHLDGYKGSRPVRIGNGAYSQVQLESFGELLNIACELVDRGISLSKDLQAFLVSVAELACESWKEPDQGIWEIRGQPRHYVYTKAMIWMALDKAIRLHRACGWKNSINEWIAVREQVKNEVLDRGYDRELGCFVQSYGSKELDAANLRLPLMGLLPPNDPRVQGTIDRTMERLTENGLVYRYLSDDSFPEGEGAFGLCTFWLVDALALSGRLEEARAIFEGVVGLGNHVGLFSEQYDAATGEALGNFPQAFTHVGLINSAMNLTRAEECAVPMPMEEPALQAEGISSPACAMVRSPGLVANVPPSCFRLEPGPSPWPVPEAPERSTVVR